MATDFTTLNRDGARVPETVSIRSTWLNGINPEERGRSRSPRQSGGEPSAQEPAESGSTLGRAIRARRRELGMTQQDLATLVNRGGDDMRQSDVSRLERCHVGLPRSQRLQQIAKALNIPPADLLARGGWSGAESSFSIECGEELRAAEPVTRPFPEVAGSAPTCEHAPEYPGESDALSARTEQILQRCHDEREMVRRILSGDGGRRLFRC